MISQICQAVQYVLETKIMDDYDAIDPFYLIGIQGLQQMTVFVLAFPLFFHFDKCGTKWCYSGSVDNFPKGFKEMD